MSFISNSRLASIIPNRCYAKTDLDYWMHRVCAVRTQPPYGNHVCVIAFHYQLLSWREMRGGGGRGRRGRSNCQQLHNKKLNGRGLALAGPAVVMLLAKVTWLTISLRWPWNRSNRFRSNSTSNFLWFENKFSIGVRQSRWNEQSTFLFVTFTVLVSLGISLLYNYSYKSFTTVLVVYYFSPDTRNIIELETTEVLKRVVPNNFANFLPNYILWLKFWSFKLDPSLGHYWT